MDSKDAFLALLVVIVWGCNWVALRLGLNGIPPMFLVFLRFTFSVIPAVFFIRRPALPWRWVIAYGLTMGVMQYSLLYLSLSMGMPAGLASVVAQSQAFFTLGFAAVLLRERVRPIQFIGLLVSLVGLVLIALRFEQEHVASMMSFALLLTSALGWGVSNVVSRMASQRYKFDPIAFTIWSSLVVPLPMLALSLLMEGVPRIEFAMTHLTWVNVIAGLYTSYLSTVFAFSLWNRLIAQRGATQVAPFALLVPFFGLSSTALVLGEKIEAMTLLGGALVLIGLAFNVFGARWLSARRATTV
jgi:O-acetylserine/cysteine efflux transporter